MILRSLLLIMVLGSVSLSAVGQLQTTLDKASMAADETVILTIISTDHLHLSPDLTPLENDFDVLGNSRNYHIKIINGSTQMESQWQIALSPKHPGDLQIPALQVGSEKTEPQYVHVAAAAKENTVPTSNGSADIFIHATVTPKEFFVQEQFIYTLKVYLARSIENGSLGPPSMPDANIIQNGQDIHYTTTHKGKFYHVVERSYLITPQKDGHFVVESPILKGYMPDSSGVVDLYGFTNQRVKPIQVSASPINVLIKPKPTNFTGHWLPAKKITLNETWEPQPLVFREGEPVTRVIEVNAEGATGEQIPSIAPTQTPHMNTYPQQAVHENINNAGVPVGKLQQKITYIPTKPGQQTLPAIKVHWWNTQTKKDAYATLPSKTIRVLPAISTQATSSLHSRPVVKSTEPSSQGHIMKKNHQRADTRYFWPVLALLFFVIWLVTLFLWRKQSHKKEGGQNRGPLTLKEYYQALKAACFANNPKLTRELLLNWARLYWQAPALHSLADMISKLGSDDSSGFKEEVMHLESVFYSSHSDSWEGAHFWSVFEQWVVMSNRHPKSDPNDPLPPLYYSS